MKQAMWRSREPQADLLLPDLIMYSEPTDGSDPQPVKCKHAVVSITDIYVTQNIDLRRGDLGLPGAVENCPLPPG